MQIDWLTVTAQIVNFLILVWVLKRVLYRPVLEAMSRREQAIAQRIGQAEQREWEADSREHSYEEKERALERERDHLLALAREEAAHVQRGLLEEARHDIDRQREKWHEELRHEQEDFRAAFRRSLAESALRIAQNALADLADAGLERQILAAFARRLRAVPDIERKELADGTGRLRVTTSFDLDETARERIAAVLRDALGDGAGIEFEYRRDPALICGVAVSSDGRKLAWSIADYVEDAEASIAELLGERGDAAMVRA